MIHGNLPVMADEIGHLMRFPVKPGMTSGLQREKGTKSERRMPRLSGGDERRGKLRKGSGICKQELIRASLNGGTQWIEDPLPSVKMGRTRGTETS